MPSAQLIDSHTLAPPEDSGKNATAVAAPDTAHGANPVAYCGVPVMTTENLAEALGGTAKNLTDNYSNNKDRFTEGDHVFKVVGHKLAALRLRTDEIGSQISPKTRNLMLWTERGAFRHAKLLNTPEAWQAYERLETTYFAVKDGKLLPVPVSRERVAPVFRDFMSIGKMIGLRGNQQIIAANRAATKLTGINALDVMGETKLIEETKRVSYPPTIIAERMDIKSAIAINKLLEKYGFQTCHADEEPRWNPTEFGMPHAELITADPAHGKGKARKHWQWYLSGIGALSTAISADTQEG